MYIIRFNRVLSKKLFVKSKPFFLIPSAILLTVLVLFCACKNRDNKIVDYKPEYVPDTAKARLMLGLPGFSYYGAFDSLTGYFNNNITGARLRLVAENDITAFNNNIASGKFDISILNVNIAIQYDSIYEIAGRPVPMEGNGLYGVIITRKDSSLKEISQLKGKSICFPDPNAIAGTILPIMYLQKNGIDVNHEITKQFVASMESSIMNVYLGKCSAGSSFSLAWEMFRKNRPDIADKLTVSWRTEEMLTSALILKKSMAPELKKKVKELFFSLHTTEMGRSILGHSLLLKYEKASPEDYKSVMLLLKEYEKILNN